MNITLSLGRPAQPAQEKLGATSEKKVKDPLEWLIVMYPAEKMMRLAQLPGSQIQANLPFDCRFRQDTVAPKVMTGGIASLMAFALLLVAFYPVSNTVADALVAAGSVGLVLGGIVGQLLGPRFGPKPLSVVSLGEEGEVYPYQHTKFSKDEYEIVPDEEGNPQVVPQVYRASSVHQDAMAKDEIDEYKVPESMWQKIELGLVAVIALASLGLFALFGVAIAG